MTTHCRSRLTFLILATVCSGVALAHDENVYFTLQGGTTSTRMTNISDVGGSFQPGTTADSLNLERSGMYGMKAGFYSRTGVLGLEGEIFRSNPNVRYGTQTFYEPTFGPFPQTRAGKQDVTAYAFNVIARQPITERTVLHAGLGPAYFTSNLQFDNEQKQTSSKWGLNTQLGVTYFVTKQFMVSAEWKYNQVKFDFPTHGTTEGFKTNYSANHFALGLTYAFDWASPWRLPSLREKLGANPAHIGPKQ